MQQPQRPKVEISFHPEDVAEPESLSYESQHAARPLKIGLAPRAQWLLGAVALFVLALASSAPSITGKFLLADDANLTANPVVRSWHGLAPIWLAPWRLPQLQPIANTAYLVQYQMFHDSPAGYRAVNLLLHAAVVLLLWTLLRKLELSGAWLAAALFALHPVTVGSVAWISQQPTLWCALFYLGSLIIYFRYAGLNPEPPEDPAMAPYFVPQLPTSRWMLYTLGMLLLTLALLSNAMLAATFAPVVLVAIWWERARITRHDLIPLIFPTAFCATGFVLGAWHTVHAGAHGTEYPTLAQRLVLPGRAIWFDAITAILPLRLSFAYARWTLSSASILQWLPTLAAIAVLVSLWRLRQKIGRSPFAGAVLFGILVLPFSGIVNHPWMPQSFVADQFLYLACAIPAIAVAVLIAKFVQSKSFSMQAIISGALVTLLLIASMTHATDYNYQPRLWAQTLKNNPRSVLAHNSLGNLALQSKNIVMAEGHFKDALAVDPENLDAHRHMAALFEERDQSDRAIGEYYAVLRRSPDDAAAHFGLANAMARQGDSRGAMTEYSEALRLQPYFARASLNLGQLHFDRGELDEAVACFRDAIASDPRMANAHLNLANALFKQQKFEEAIEQINAANEIEPTFITFLNAASMLAEMSRVDPAKRTGYLRRANEYLGAAIKLKTDSPLAYYNRGIVLAQLSGTESRKRALQMWSEAILCFRKAAALEPENENYRRAELNAIRDRDLRESRSE